MGYLVREGITLGIYQTMIFLKLCGVCIACNICNYGNISFECSLPVLWVFVPLTSQCVKQAMTRLPILPIICPFGPIQRCSPISFLMVYELPAPSQYIHCLILI